MIAKAIARFLSRQPKWRIVVVGALFIVADAAINVITGREFLLLGFMLLPVLLGGLFVGWRAALGLAVLAAAATLTVELQWGGMTLTRPLVWNTASALVMVVVTARIGSALKVALEHEQDLARTDALTGAANRRAFVAASAHEIGRSQRYKHPLTVAYIDLDNFKFVNDRDGHAVGDTLLRLVADIARRNVRAVDLVARLGGDEFAVLLPETGLEAGLQVLTRVQQQVGERARSNQWNVTLSIGLVTFLRPPATVDDLLREADAQMYTAKTTGKDKIQSAIVGA